LPQPDLIGAIPKVVEAILDVLRFWLDIGVDGFCVDAMHHLIERNDVADNPTGEERLLVILEFRGAARR
jgi:alpha-glucosidase